MKTCDLHTHSYYSDGEMSPKEVMKLAKQRGVKILALTDHNSTKGVKEAINEGRKLGIKVIPAIEVMAKEDEVLGYFIDANNKRFQNNLADIRKRIESKIKKRCENMQKKGFPASFHEIKKRFPHAKGNIDDFYPYYMLILKGYGKTFRDIGILMKQTGVKKARGKDLSIAKVIRMIKNAGGVPVLAHPWADDKSKRLLQDKNFRKLVKAGLKGIEVDNGNGDGRRNAKIVSKIKRLAKKYNLITTSGSDFHGEDLADAKAHVLGKYNCDEKIVRQLEALAGRT